MTLPTPPEHKVTKAMREILFNKCGQKWSEGNIFLCPKCFGKEEQMTPNQEPVEREEIKVILDRIKQWVEFDNTHESLENLLDTLGDDLFDTISHQKALSRAQVLEEIKKTLLDKQVFVTYKKDGGHGLAVPLVHIISLSDTLALVDEMKGSK